MKEEIRFIVPPNPSVPSNFPGDRVFLCTMKKSELEGLPWDSKKDEGDFENNPNLCIVSVTRKDFIQSFNEEKVLEFKEKGPRQTRKTKKKSSQFVFPAEKLEVSVLQDDLTVTIDGELSIYNPGNIAPEIKIPSNSYRMSLVNIHMGANELGIWIGFFKDGIFYGRTLTSWKMVKNGDYGPITLTIEGLDTDTE